MSKRVSRRWKRVILRRVMVCWLVVVPSRPAEFHVVRVKGSKLSTPGEKRMCDPGGCWSPGACGSLGGGGRAIGRGRSARSSETGCCGGRAVGERSARLSGGGGCVGVGGGLP